MVGVSSTASSTARWTRSSAICGLAELPAAGRAHPVEGPGIPLAVRTSETATSTSAASRTGAQPSTKSPLVPAEAALCTDPGTAQTGVARRAAASAV